LPEESAMDRYQRVEKPRPNAAAISENEIRITTQGLIRNYVTYATSLLQVPRPSRSRGGVLWLIDPIHDACVAMLRRRVRPDPAATCGAWQ
jgi:hypothetical protein